MLNQIIITLFYTLLATPIVFIASQFYINEWENRLISDSRDYLRFFKVKSDQFSEDNKPYHKFPIYSAFLLAGFFAISSFVAQYFFAPLQLYSFLGFLLFLGGLSLIDLQTSWLPHSASTFLGAIALALGHYAEFELHIQVALIIFGLAILVELFREFVPAGTGDLYFIAALSLIFGIHAVSGTILFGTALSVLFTIIGAIVISFKLKRKSNLKPRPFKSLFKFSFKLLRVFPFGPYIVIGTLISYFTGFSFNMF